MTCDPTAEYSAESSWKVPAAQLHMKRRFTRVDFLSHRYICWQAMALYQRRVSFVDTIAAARKVSEFLNIRPLRHPAHPVQLQGLNSAPSADGARLVNPNFNPDRQGNQSTPE